MTRAAEQVKLFAILFVFWLLLNGALSPAVLATGAVAAGAIALLSGAAQSFLTGYRLVPRSLTATLVFAGFFVKELVKANLQIARIVLSPSLPVQPAIVRVRTTLKEPVARLLLANSITLTPGTLSVEIQGEWLYVHWVVAETTDAEAATQTIVKGFERYLEVMYG